MFFSSAITAILPYLLFLGVLSTFFYGITEKLNAFSGNNTAKHQCIDSESYQLTGEIENPPLCKQSYYVFSQNKNKDKRLIPKTNGYSKKHLDLYTDNEELRYFQITLYSFPVISVYSLRGPPKAG
jgi:hypothetical protein